MGVAAHLFYTALLGDVDVRYIPNTLFGVLDFAWLFVNGALALAVAAFAVRRRGR